MTTEEEKRIFHTVCLENLKSVIEKYHLVPERLMVKESSIGGGDESMETLLCNNTTGLSFQTISYGTELGVTLYRLIDGKTVVAKGSAYSLDWIILLRNPKLRVNSSLKLPSSLLEQPMTVISAEPNTITDAYRIENYKRLFLEYAKAVDECASDVMRGDFTIFEELRNMSETQWQKLYKRRNR